MRNRYDSFCFKCGNYVKKGNGHPEKTSFEHRKIGIKSKWVTRCKDCVGITSYPNSVLLIVNLIKQDLLNSITHYDSVWFDNYGKGNISFVLIIKENYTKTLKTTITSNKINEHEIMIKQNSLKNALLSIK